LMRLFLALGWQVIDRGRFDQVMYERMKKWLYRIVTNRFYELYYGHKDKTNGRIMPHPLFSLLKKGKRDRELQHKTWKKLLSKGVPL
ncbi:MAG: hypothetical protein K6T85_19760, partial [Gorillibacterium sp.]|nr:hypothetical protein [Gorillibacterium sp.]